MVTNHEIQARIQQMIIEDPHGKEAADLLQRISISKIPLSRRLLTVLAPKDMSRLMRAQALMTLIKWGFAVKNTDYDIVLIEGVQALFPEDMSVLETLLRHLEFQGVEVWLFALINAIDALEFCQRFVSTHPIAILHLIKVLRAFDDEAVLADAMSALEHLDDPVQGYWSLWSISNQRKDTRLKEAVYDMMLTFYETRQNPHMQQYVLISRGSDARERQDTPVMLRCYEQAVALDPVNRQLTFGIYSALIDKTLKAFQHKQGLEYFGYAQAWAELPRTGRGQNTMYLDSLAIIAEKLGLYDVARTYHARYTQARETADGLWHWAEFEHRHGQHEDSCRLFEFSMIALRKMYDSRDPSVDIDKLLQIRIRAMQDLGCEWC
jgi:hypothetical protein